MSSWSRVDPEHFRRLNLQAHPLLESVPIHDVWQVDLPGGGPDRTLDDIRRILRAKPLSEVNPVVRSLFALRSRLGALFGWDSADASREGDRPLHPIPQTLREQSRVRPGSSDGPFTVLYALEREGMNEIRNATVHAFSVMALEPAPEGYRLFWAIYVEPVSWLTPLYMALIAPFRRFLVYPAILRQLRRAWLADIDATPS